MSIAPKVAVCHASSIDTLSFRFFIRLQSGTRRAVGFYLEKQRIDYSQYLTYATSEQMDYLPATDESGEKSLVHVRVPFRNSSTRPPSIYASAVDEAAQMMRTRKNVCTKSELAHAVFEYWTVDPKSENVGELSSYIKEIATKMGTAPFGLDPTRPGMAKFAYPGLIPEIKSPNIPNQEFLQFDEVIIRDIAALLGLSREVLTLDASEPNFSSMRSIMELSKVSFRWFQKNILNDMFNKPWWVFKIRCLAHNAKSELGRDIRRFRYDPRKATFNTPGWHGLDAVKDVESDNAKMVNGHQSISSTLQERGTDYSQELTHILSDVENLLLAQMETVIRLKPMALQIGLTERQACPSS